jgi:hypothetical protein
VHLAFFPGGSEAVSVVCLTVFWIASSLTPASSFLIGGDSLLLCDLLEIQLGLSAFQVT